MRAARDNPDSAQRVAARSTLLKRVMEDNAATQSRADKSKKRAVVRVEGTNSEVTGQDEAAAAGGAAAEGATGATGASPALN